MSNESLSLAVFDGGAAGKTFNSPLTAALAVLTILTPGDNASADISEIELLMSVRR
jgi:hypothetical protein